MLSVNKFTSQPNNNVQSLNKLNYNYTWCTDTMIHASFKPVYNFNLYPTCKCSYEMSNIGVTKFFKLLIWIIRVKLPIGRKYRLRQL